MNSESTLYYTSKKLVASRCINQEAPLIKDPRAPGVDLELLELNKGALDAISRHCGRVPIVFLLFFFLSSPPFFLFTATRVKQPRLYRERTHASLPRELTRGRNRVIAISCKSKNQKCREICAREAKGGRCGKM